MDLKFYELNKYKMIYRLTGFEGLQLSYLQVVDILGQRQGYVEGSEYSYKDYLIVTNLDRALQFCVTFPNVNDELMVITGIHEKVVEGLLENPLAVGAFRSKDLMITETEENPSPYTLVENVDWFNEKVQGLTCAEDCVRFLCELIKRLLFVDGNKRTAYIFINHLLCRLGKYLAVPEIELQGIFFNYLEEYYKDDACLEPLVKYLMMFYLKDL